MLIVRKICLAMGAIAVSGLASAEDCGSRQAVVDDLKQKIDRDKNAIKSLGFNTDSAEFDAWVSASEEQRNQMVRTRFKNILSGLTGAALVQVEDWAAAALEPQANLPNGFASLNPINVNAYIKGLDNPNGPVAWLLKQVASTSDKAAKLKFLRGLSDAVDLEEGYYDLRFGEASTQPKSLTDYLNLTEALAKLLGFSQAAAALEIGTSGAEVLVAYMNLFQGNVSALYQLNRLTVANAQALATYDSMMRADVQALRTAKLQLDSCTRGHGPFSISYSRNGTYMSIAVGFEGAAPRNSVDAWLSGPGGLMQGMSVCSQPAPASKNGRQVAGVFYAGCQSPVSAGHWEVNVCPTSTFSDARFQCSQTWEAGTLVFSHCGCGVNTERYPKYEPEFSIPVDLAPGQSVWIKIRSQ